MSNNLTTAGRLLKIKRHQIEMVRDRGYDVSQELPLLQISDNDFFQYYGTAANQRRVSLRSLLSQVYQKPQGDDRLLVFYAEMPTKKQVGIDTIKDLITMMKQYQATNGILISEAPVSSQSMEEFRKVPLYRVQVFDDSELMYNPTKHYLVPQHRELSAEETKQFLRENKVQINKMPILAVSGEKIDAIGKWYNFQPGRVIEIIRENFMFETDVPREVAYRAAM